MGSGHRKINWAALTGTLFAGAAVGAVIHYFASSPCPPVVACPTLPFVAYYDGGDLAEMAKADGADGVRFYLAKDAAGRYTAVAGPIDAAGMHVAETGADLKFWMYNGISSGAADMTMLNEDEAVGIVKASSTASRKAYCMQAGAEALREVLSTTVANGLGLVERKTADKMWTFDLVPVKMAGTTADQAGDITNMRVGAPCPNFCGSVPEYCLNMR